MSPWAYPGGKGSYVKSILPHVKKLKRDNSILIEPFVGGGSIFLAADFPRTIINDLDPAIADFWRKCFQESDDDFDAFLEELLNPTWLGYYACEMSLDEISELMEKSTPEERKAFKEKWWRPVRLDGKTFSRAHFTEMASHT